MKYLEKTRQGLLYGVARYEYYGDGATADDGYDGWGGNSSNNGGNSDGSNSNGGYDSKTGLDSTGKNQYGQGPGYSSYGGNYSGRQSRGGSHNSGDGPSEAERLLVLAPLAVKSTVNQAAVL